MFIILTLFLAAAVQPYLAKFRKKSSVSRESVPRYLLESSNKIYNMGPGRPPGPGLVVT